MLCPKFSIGQLHSRVKFSITFSSPIIVGVVGKPIPTFLIAVLWGGNFDILNRFLTNRQNIAQNLDFRMRVTRAASGAK